MRTSISLVALTGALVLSASALAQPTPNHIYELNETLGDSLGGDALTTQGSVTLGSFGATIDNDPAAHSGLVLGNAVSAFTSPGVYSIEMLFTPASVSGYGRLLNTDTGTDDGLYISSGQLNIYDDTGETYDHLGEATFGSETPVHLIYARDNTGMSVFLNGVLDLSTSNFATGALTSYLKFFIDNESAGFGDEEISSVFADFIRTYDTKLTGQDAATLYNGGDVLSSASLIASPTPEPATWAMMIMGFGFVGAALRRRRRTLVAA